MNKAIIIILAVLITSCDWVYYKRGNGHMVTKSYDVKDFDELELRGDYKVNLIESDEPGVEIEADENLLGDIDVFVRGRSLRVESERIRSRKDRTVNVFYKELNGISAGGATDMATRMPIRSKFFDLSLAGAGEIDLDFEGEKLSITMSGAGDIQLSGTTTDLDIKMSGAGGLDAYDLKAEYARVRISGVGGADVYVTRELEAHISGLGDINYKGNPKVVDRQISGLGSINQVDRDRAD